MTIGLPRVHALIPVRLASKRFPNKPLFMVGTQPLLECLVKSVVASRLFSSVTVVSEDRPVLALARSLNVGVCDVAGPFRNGTMRVCAAVQSLGLEDELVVNIQGDMPGIDPCAMAALIDALRSGKGEAITLARYCQSSDERLDVNRVKAVVDGFGNALYFSRTAIPYGASFSETLIHVGVYGFASGALARYVASEVSPLSIFEDLEQLDWLGSNLNIGVVSCEWSVPSLDGPDDAQLVCAWQQGRVGVCV